MDSSCELSETDFKQPTMTAQGGRFLVREEKVRFEYFDDIETQLAFFDFHTDWDQVQLVSWLERNIPDHSISPDEKAAFLDKAITWLKQWRGFKDQDLVLLKIQAPFCA